MSTTDQAQVAPRGVTDPEEFPALPEALKRLPPVEVLPDVARFRWWPIA